MLRLAEQGRKAGARIEVRQAEPVNRAVATDERRGLAVADGPYPRCAETG